MLTSAVCGEHGLKCPKMLFMSDDQQNNEAVASVAGLHWILSPEPDVAQPLVVPVIEDLLQNAEYLSGASPLTWLRTALLVNPKQIAETASATVGQRENPHWAAIRKLRFTASNFGDLLKAAEKKRFILVDLIHCNN